MKKTMIAAALLLALSSARAGFYTGNELLQFMNSADTAENTLALGFIAGVNDANRGVTHCPVRGVTLGQLKDMTQAFLREKPQIRHLGAADAVSYVLAQAWPCPKKAGTPL